MVKRFWMAVGFAIALVLADLVLFVSQSVLVDCIIARGALRGHVLALVVGLVTLLGVCWLKLNVTGPVALATAATAVVATAAPTLKILWMRRAQLYGAV